ncbi:hypothetical protein PG993_009117 [Apiospora rasikravindrae]|uniref:Uncharacterized protein n=1 Tax=Apiospora rasikravindrae TaxID=990691 RepID=A0ABR1SIJ3_9PEZI
MTFTKLEKIPIKLGHGHEARSEYACESMLTPNHHSKDVNCQGLGPTLTSGRGIEAGLRSLRRRDCSEDH